MLTGMRRLPTPLICALLALAAAGCGSSGPHRLPTRPPVSRTPLLSILQEDSIMQTDPAALLTAARRLGVQVIRANVFWGHIAPDPTAVTPPKLDLADPHAYPDPGWAPYDAMVRAAATTGVQLDFTLTGPPPRWAAGRGAPQICQGPCNQWRPSAADYGAFVRAIGTRYSGHFTPAGATAPLPRVRFWSLWNEPNYGPNLAPQAVDHSQVESSPALYRALLTAGWGALDATGHSTATDTILVGETAPRGEIGPNLPGNFSGMVPLRFVRALYCVDQRFQPLRGRAATLRGCPATGAGAKGFAAANPALFHASGWADHPYPDALAPNVPTTIEPDYSDFAALGNLERTLDRAAGVYGADPRLPIYSTEYGYRTQPPGPLGVSLPTAAAFLNQSEYLSWSSSRIRSYDQYLLSDPDPASGSHFVTGIEFADGQPKPDVYDAYRMPLWLPVTRAAKRTALEVWGCVRPAPAAGRTEHRPQRVAIEFAPAGGPFTVARRVTLTPAGGCYFDVRVRFPGSGSVRLGWKGPGGNIHSRVQAITLQ